MRSFKKGNGVGGNPLFSPHGPQAFRGGRLDVHRALREAQQRSNAGAHGRHMGRDPGALRHQG
jgi:hypothetical protein